MTYTEDTDGLLPARYRVDRVLWRHGIQRRMGAAAQPLMDDLTNIIELAELTGYDLVIDGLREQCLNYGHKPEIVTILRGIETLLLANRRSAFAQPKPTKELVLCPPY
jgi:hypothetical protein